MTTFGNFLFRQSFTEPQALDECFKTLLEPFAKSIVPLSMLGPDPTANRLRGFWVDQAGCRG